MTLSLSLQVRNRCNTGTVLCQVLTIVRSYFKKLSILLPGANA